MRQVALLLQGGAAVLHTHGISDGLDHFQVVHAVAEADRIRQGDSVFLRDDPDAAALVELPVDQFPVQAEIVK